MKIRFYGLESDFKDHVLGEVESTPTGFKVSGPRSDMVRQLIIGPAFDKDMISIEPGTGRQEAAASMLRDEEYLAALPLKFRSAYLRAVVVKEIK